MSILLYGCTIWTIIKRMEKKLDGNYTIMLQAIFNKSCRQEPIYNSSVPIQDVALKTNGERWTIETGGKKESGRSMLAARNDDDDDDNCKTSVTKNKVRKRVYLFLDCYISVAFQCISHLVFSSFVLLELRWCIHTIVLTLLQLGRRKQHPTKQ